MAALPESGIFPGKDEFIEFKHKEGCDCILVRGHSCINLRILTLPPARIGGRVLQNCDWRNAFS